MEHRRIGIVDTTLRDGVQCLWSGRLECSKVLPIVMTMDRAGFEAIDLMAGVTMEVWLRYLREHPWERVRAIRRVVRRTPLIAHIRGRSLTSFDVVPDELIQFMVTRLAANGIRRLMVFDPLHDIDNLGVGVRAGKEAGLEVSVIIFYTISPIHSDEYYARKAAQLASLKVDHICLRDPTGLLTPERVATLVPVIRTALGSLPLQLKSHCQTGLAPTCYLDAIKHGVNTLYTATAPLANGASVPAHEDIVAGAEQMGYKTGVDPARLKDMAEYYSQVAQDDNKVTGKPVESFDKSIYVHQVPGGMIAFLRDQLREMRMEHRLQDVLEEIPRVREDLGYPVMVTPTSQLVGTQAVLNVVLGERYKAIPEEVRRYVLGYYGSPEMPIAPNVRDRITRKEEDELQQAEARDGASYLEAIRRKFGPFDSDDDLLLYALFRPNYLDGVINRQTNGRPYQPMRIAALVKELAQQRNLSYVAVENKDFSLCMQSQATRETAAPSQ